MSLGLILKQTKILVSSLKKKKKRTVPCPWKQHKEDQNRSIGTL